MLASFAIEWWLTKERRLVTEKIVIVHKKRARERERERETVKLDGNGEV
jgi:hypothetical protein